METNIRTFWWGHQHHQKKIHLLSWQKLAKPTRQGGLGFCKTERFNRALLAR